MYFHEKWFERNCTTAGICVTSLCYALTSRERKYIYWSSYLQWCSRVAKYLNCTGLKKAILISQKWMGYVLPWGMWLRMWSRMWIGYGHRMKNPFSWESKACERHDKNWILSNQLQYKYFEMKRQGCPKAAALKQRMWLYWNLGCTSQTTILYTDSNTRTLCMGLLTHGECFQQV